MNDHQIASFILAAEMKTFSGAARASHISTPAFSQQIKLLERELGFALFHRSKKGVELTTAGEAFYATALEMRRVLREGLDRAAELSALRQRSLVIACDTSGQPPAFEAQFVSSFKRICPDVSISFQPIPYEEVFHQIVNGQADICFFTPPPAAYDELLRFEPLYSDRIFCCMNPSDPLTRCDAIKMSDLATRTVFVEGPAAQDPQMASFFESGLANIIPEPFSTAQLMRVQYEDGLIFIPENYLGSCCPPLVAVPLDWPPIQHGITFRRTCSGTVGEFVACAQRFFNQA